MRRRLTITIMAVCTAALATVGIPLGIALHVMIYREQAVRLNDQAARVAAQVRLPLADGNLGLVIRESSDTRKVALYSATGVRMIGEGPALADDLTSRALSGAAASSSGQHFIVAFPIDYPDSSSIGGAVRIEASGSSARHRQQLAWLALGGLWLCALGLCALLARRQARRSIQPLTDLVAWLDAYEPGMTLAAQKSSGLYEIDALHDAITEGSQRIQESLLREQQFSADVSHQLRTPLTGLRLRLEAVQRTPESPSMDGAMADLDHLQSTLEHLLSVARGARPSVTSFCINEAVGRAAGRWSIRFIDDGRQLLHDQVQTPITASGASSSVDQILDVLIDNAHRYGTGVVTVSARSLPGAAAIDVTDQGDGLTAADDDRIFQRGHGSGHGLGLSLARDLAEAEGGRLLLSSRSPTRFSLVLPAPPSA